METKEIIKKSTDILHESKTYLVDSKESLESTAIFLKTVKDLQKEIHNTFDPIITKAHQAHKEAISQMKKHLLPLEQAEKIIKNKITDYRVEEERKRKIERERLEKEAREKEEKRRLEQAEKLEKQGHSDLADKILNQPEIKPVVKTEDNTKVDGVQYRKVWKYEIIDFSLLPDEYKMPDDKKIGGVIRALKEDTNIKGIKVFYEETIISR